MLTCGKLDKQNLFTSRYLWFCFLLRFITSNKIDRLLLWVYIFCPNNERSIHVPYDHMVKALIQIFIILKNVNMRVFHLGRGLFASRLGCRLLHFWQKWVSAVNLRL